MKEYYFALVDPQHSDCDLRAGAFPSPEHALQLAELIAFDLSIESKWNGWTIEVCNAQGRRLFSVPVPDRGQSRH